LGPGFGQTFHKNITSGAGAWEGENGLSNGGSSFQASGQQRPLNALLAGRTRCCCEGPASKPAEWKKSRDTPSSARGSRMRVRIRLLRGVFLTTGGAGPEAQDSGSVGQTRSPSGCCQSPVWRRSSAGGVNRRNSGSKLDPAPHAAFLGITRST